MNITYDWKIRAEKPLLRYLSLLMKPIFSANHRWAILPQFPEQLDGHFFRIRVMIYP